jgi:hypothetical protein
MGLPRIAALFGGLLGLFFGHYFWPKLYDEHGNLQWSRFRKKLKG